MPDYGRPVEEVEEQEATKNRVKPIVWIILVLVVAWLAVVAGYYLYTGYVNSRQVSATAPTSIVIQPTPTCTFVKDGCGNPVKFCGVLQKSVPAPANYVEVGREDIGRAFRFKALGADDGCYLTLPPVKGVN